MKVVISGGAASGKSAHAERILCRRSQPDSRLYVATMQPFGKNAEMRIARHRALRRGKGFDTAERYTDLEHFRAEKHYSGILLECMSNLLANEMFAPEGAGMQAMEPVLRGVTALEQQCDVLVIVTNEIFSDGEIYPAETMQYMEQLGGINRALFQQADAAAESVCGILVPYKGESLL